MTAALPLPGQAQDTARPSAVRQLEQVVAAGNRLFALAGGEVAVFDVAGQLLGRCTRFAAPPPRQTPARIGAPDAQEALRAAGLPDNDDSTPEAEEALENEGLGPPRRPRPPLDRGIVPHALAAAAGAGAAWIATSSGMFRGDEQGCSPAGLDGRDLLLVAGADGTALAASEELLFRADSTGGPVEESTGAFVVAAGLTERPRALAVASDGAALVADDEGVTAIGLDGGRTRILDRGADALVVCGGVAVALGRDGVYRWTQGEAPVRVAERPPVRAIACGPGGEARWVATGVGVWTSPNAAVWTERREALGLTVRGAATTGDRIWLAGADGLTALEPRPPEGDARSPGDWTAPGVDFAPLPMGRWAPPRLPLPLVTAVFDAQQTVDRRAFAVMIYLTFPFGRVLGGRLDSTLVPGELVRRDEALAREQVHLEKDACANAEAAARLEAVLAEREALR